MAASRQSTSQASASPLTETLHVISTQDPGEDSVHLQQHPNLYDLRTVAADIKDTLSAAITDFRLDIHTIADRVQEVEKTSALHDTVLRRVTHKVDTQTL